MRRATIRTTHDEPETVAAAVTPDNTEEMATQVEGDRVVTTIERETTGSLASTVDDYVVNLSVAERAAESAIADRPAEGALRDGAAERDHSGPEQHADRHDTDQP